MFYSITGSKCENNLFLIAMLDKFVLWIRAYIAIIYVVSYVRTSNFSDDEFLCKQNLIGFYLGWENYLRS